MQNRTVSFYTAFTATLLSTLMTATACEHDHANASLPVASLDFQRTTPAGEPFGWFIEGDRAAAGIEVHADINGAAYLTVANTGDDPVFLYTVIPAETCDHELSVSFEMRSQGEGAAAAVILRPALDGPLFDAPTQAGEDWLSLQHQSRSDTCLETGIGVGALVFGSVDIRSFDVRRNGARVQPPHLQPVMFDHLDAVTALAIDPRAFAERVDTSDARQVIALGETSHGAAGLFTLKFETIKAFAARDELGVFALEVPVAAGDIINEYVLGETDNIDRVIDALAYPAWRTEEMIEIIDWLRAHNQTSTSQVRFAGFDVQHPVWAARRLMGMGVERDALTAILNAEALDTSLELLDELETDLVNRPDAVRHIRLLRRGLLVGRPDFGGASRASYMADEVLRLAQDEDAAVILWADNTHISKIPGSMGARLKSELGAGYTAIGLSFAAGAYSAYGPATPYPAEPAYEGTHEHLLRDAGLDGGFLHLSDLAADHPLKEARGWRFIGSRPQEFGQFLPHQLEDHFDAIGFVRETGATTYLPGRAPE